MVETQNKIQDKGSALKTLSCIEEVMRKGLAYSAAANNSYSKMSQSELREQLQLKAKSIRDGFLSKTQNISCIRRFFGSIAQKEQVIRSAYERIENLASPPPVLALPDEWIQYILGFRQVGDLRKLAQTNKHASTHVKQFDIQRAQEYGYKGHDLTEARDYLRNLFQGIDILVQDGFIVEEYVVRRGQWSFWCYVDSEDTLRNIKYLSNKKQTELKQKFRQSGS